MKCIYISYLMFKYSSSHILLPENFVVAIFTIISLYRVKQFTLGQTDSLFFSFIFFSFTVEILSSKSGN